MNDDNPNITDAEINVQDSEQDEGRGGPPLWVIGLAVVAIVIALVIGLQVFRALYGLVFPPDPPLPDEITELSHNNKGHGYDEWSYASPLNACELTTFYIEQGSNCVITEGMCTDDRYQSPGYSLESAATCYGTATYSVFGLRWEVIISTKWSQDGDSTTFELERETLWAGPAPIATSTLPPTPINTATPSPG